MENYTDMSIFNRVKRYRKPLTELENTLSNK